jgi:branched-chain amino acid transport system permease protein
MKYFRIVFVVLLAAALLLVTTQSNPYWTRLATTFLMYGTLALSWNIIGGMTGYPSFASVAFFGIGAYVGSIMQIYGVHFSFAIVIAGLSVLVFAWMFGGIVLHLRGRYFAIATMMAGEVVREIVNNSDSITGGGMGLNVPLMSGSIIDQARIYLLAMAACCVGAALLCVFVARSKLGSGLRCIAQNEDAATSLGVNTKRYKDSAFALSSVFVGCAGAVYASWVTYIDPNDVFDGLLSVKPIVMVLIGGASVWIGPIVGALVFITFEEVFWRNFLHFNTGLLGLFIVMLILFLPKGLSGGLPRFKWWQRS